VRPQHSQAVAVGFSLRPCHFGASRESVIVIGDQFFTDILGREIFGSAAILEEPLGGRGNAGDRSPVGIRSAYRYRTAPCNVAELTMGVD
jgi:hypothetical protein